VNSCECTCSCADHDPAAHKRHSEKDGASVSVRMCARVYACSRVLRECTCGCGRTRLRVRECWCACVRARVPVFVFASFRGVQSWTRTYLLR
jgi:hypothetical protein